MADLPLTGLAAALLEAAPSAPGNVPAHGPGPPRIPRHAHRGTLLRGAPGPLRRQARTARGDHHRVRPRVRVHGAQRRKRPPSCPGCSTCRAVPAGAATGSPSLGGWSKAAAKDFRILMLDQRGTGLSSPIDRNTLPLRGNDADQAALPDAFPRRLHRRRRRGHPAGPGLRSLDHLRPELWRVLRAQLPLLRPRGSSRSPHHRRPGARWPDPRTACTRPRSGGSRPGTPNTLAGIPEDRPTVTRIARHLRDTEEFLPDGGRLTVERFQMVGSFLGGNTRVDAPAPPAGGRLCRALPAATGSRTPSWNRSGASSPGPANPLYALMHESIYGQGEATDWAAWRVLQEFPEFRPDAAEPLLTGEMVYPWYFEQDPALRPLQERRPAAGRKGRLGAAVRSGPAGAQHRARSRGRLQRRHLRGPGALPGNGGRRPRPAGVGVRGLPP